MLDASTCDAENHHLILVYEALDTSVRPPRLRTARGSIYEAIGNGVYLLFEAFYNEIQIFIQVWLSRLSKLCFLHAIMQGIRT